MPTTNRPTVAALALGLSLAACKPQAPEQQNVQQAPANIGNIASIGNTQAAFAPGALDKAVAATFGKTAAQDIEDDHYSFANHKLIAAPFGPVLVSEGTADNAAHVTPGVIAATYLKAAGDSFTVAHRYWQAVKTGTFGEVGSWSMRNDFGPDPVIEAHGGGTFQGYTCGYTTLTALAPGGPVELATFQSGFDDTGANGKSGSTIDGAITKVDPGKSFTVHFSGSRSFDAHYTRDGERYVLQGGDAHRLDGC